jgi:hypothetical protein
MTGQRYAIEAPAASVDLVEMMAPPPVITPLALTKRAEFFLEEMLAAGPGGITTIDYPGVRVGDAIHKLRKAGVSINTTYEEHGGEFAGHHGRYVLLSKIVRIDAPMQPGSRSTGMEASHG